ncbi:MAG: DUF1365 domain-containing protein [Acidobacteriota bacterium]
MSPESRALSAAGQTTSEGTPEGIFAGAPESTSEAGLSVGSPSEAGLHSALYVGKLRHRRFDPLEHDFRYSVFMVYLDLGELDRVFADRWLWSTRRPALGRFRRQDYLPRPGSEHLPLDELVRQLVEERSGRRPEGPVTLLTNLRYYGFGFNPVSFFYCLSPDRQELEAVVAEVHNTPWNETHVYVLSGELEPDQGSRPRARAYEHPKAFHVSPFMGMEARYAWRFTLPTEKLAVHVETSPSFRGEVDQAKNFDATLSLERREMTGSSLAGALLRLPGMSARVVAGIYWEAAKLWLKGAPFYTHPDQAPVQQERAQQEQAQHERAQ